MSGQDFLILMTYRLTYGLTVKIFVRCTTRDLKENSLKISAQSIQPFRRSCLDKFFLFLWLWTDGQGGFREANCACLKRWLTDKGVLEKQVQQSCACLKIGLIKQFPPYYVVSFHNVSVIYKILTQEYLDWLLQFLSGRYSGFLAAAVVVR